MLLQFSYQLYDVERRWLISDLLFRDEKSKL